MPNGEAAVVEWPQERRLRLGGPAHTTQRLTDISAGLLREVEAAPAFTEVSRALATAFDEKADPQAKLAELSATIARPEAFGDYDEVVRHVVLALASVTVLQKTPTREVWEYLWSLAWHSAPLETYLPQAVIATAAAESAFRDQFLVLARSVVEEASKSPGRRAIQREKETGANLREQWQRHPQLSTLWRGFFERTLYAVGRDDDHVLSIVAEIDPAEFARMLAIYDYPDPVAHALMWCGAPWHFERWRAVASAAPMAFGEHAEWTGSLILPLLLALARDQFQFGLGREPSSTQVSEVTAGIKDLAAEIAKVISQRPDALGCTTRWGNWLVRTAIPAVSANPIPHPTDAASQGFIDSVLFDALTAEMPANRWSHELAPDTETWEPWCQFSAGALVALSGKAPMPAAAGFVAEWSLTPDEWPTHRGQKLKLHAFPFEATGPRADGYGARLLALPLVEAERADVGWKKFWYATATLREIVEFGDPDGSDEGGWEGRIEAARLLMLQFSIGLMMMDHLIGLQRLPACDRRAALEGLLPLLDEAVREMAAIDQLNGKFWSGAIRHLAIRRAKWLSDPGISNGISINHTARPTLTDFIDALAGDTENLLALAYVARQNGIEISTLAVAFKSAGVDLDAEIAIAEHLLAISPRAIGLNEAQLNTAREIARDKAGSGKGAV